MSDNKWEKTEFDGSLSESNAWDDIWRKHFAEYQNDIRHAYFIRSIRRSNEHRFLEIAAGSFRDTVALNNWGYHCEGVDFSQDSVMKARKAYPKYNDRLNVMNANTLHYPGKAFDMTFHNGFWGYFDDKQIVEFGLEQKRVTKVRMIASVHNAHNKRFRQLFRDWGVQDPLYRVRFFTIPEVAKLMRHFCKRVTILPVGGGRLDRLISRRDNPILIRYLFRVRSMWRKRILPTSERLMCVGTID